MHRFAGYTQGLSSIPSLTRICDPCPHNLSKTLSEILRDFKKFTSKAIFKTFYDSVQPSVLVFLHTADLLESGVDNLPFPSCVPLPTIARIGFYLSQTKGSCHLTECLWKSIAKKCQLQIGTNGCLLLVQISKSR